MPIKEVPKGTNMLESVWSMKRKRDIMAMARKIQKHKARSNARGDQQEFDANYFLTWLPVVNPFSIRIILLLTIINEYHAQQIDFALACSQKEM